jgi:hypothetical protein
VWAFLIIFCGHFPDGVAYVPEGSVEATEPETRGAWYLRQIRGSANIEGPDWFHVLSGNLSHQIEHGTPASNGAEMTEGHFQPSSVALGHTHTVCLLETDLTSPPGWGRDLHDLGPDPMHTIALTAPQVTTISGGQSGIVSTSTNGGHNHQFVLIRM